MSGQMFPYDEDTSGFLSDGKTLRSLMGNMDSLTRATMAFGQSDSAYCDTGYPEMAAIGLRSFLSTSANIRMLQELGKARLDSLISLGVSALHHKTQGSKVAWEIAINEIQNADERTYKYVMDNVNERLEKLKRKESQSSTVALQRGPEKRAKRTVKKKRARKR